MLQRMPTMPIAINMKINFTVNMLESSQSILEQLLNPLRRNCTFGGLFSTANQQNSFQYAAEISGNERIAMHR